MPGSSPLGLDPGGFRRAHYGVPYIGLIGLGIPLGEAIPIGEGVSVSTPTEMANPPGGTGGSRVHTPIKLQPRRSRPDRVYRFVTTATGLTTFVILGLIGLFLFIQAWPAFRAMGLRFFTTSAFQTQGKHPNFGVEAALVGSITIALIAIVVALPVS